jgi:alanyl-tRNA synthetase
MDSSEIRRKFIEFFQERDHEWVPSAPIVVKDDPTLMFTNAGMNQFKDNFLGNKEARNPRVVDTQKCLRVSGKHNDLEEVGIDTYHHTMFEMLGNWSFGDYFKKEAILWGWQLLTETYQLPKERLYVTVFEGDENDNLPADNEAYNFWKELIPEDRILYFSRKDNFWEMGDTGPCGPSSEIHMDLRPQHEIDKQAGKDLVNMDHPQVIEIWNLVFIEFNRLSDGRLESLPKKHVDTGMGLERLVRAIQVKESNYDTDIFETLINHMENLAGVNYGKDKNKDIAIRVIVDHIRAIAFTIGDGQLPGNVKAGYVIRRILRRAVRYGFTYLNIKEPFLYDMIPILAEQFKTVFPELKAQQSFISRVIQEEETSFFRTLEAGIKRIEQIEKETSSKHIEGKQAFELYDTYGFPLDLTMLIAREMDLSVDQTGFNEEMAIQRQRSKKAAETKRGDWVELSQGKETFYNPYDSHSVSVRILRYREIQLKDKSLYQLVLDNTPFYAESGGQVGDTGRLKSLNETIPIIDTKKENDLIVHLTNRLPEKPEAAFTAEIDLERRQLIQKNHSATHLLHAALREVLGDHVQQKGSLVNDKMLRFDFSHFAKMTNHEIELVEKIVNGKIRENIAANVQKDVPIEEAKKKGAMALFGEKYGETVRVVMFDPGYSVELCGGTHVSATGNIGLFKIRSESSIAAGIRRIEAITSEAAEDFMVNKLNQLEHITHLLNHPKDPVQAVDQLIQENNRLNKLMEEEQKNQVLRLKDELKQNAISFEGMNVVIQEIPLPSKDALKNLAFQLKNELNNLVLVLAGQYEEKPQIAVMFSDGLVKEHSLDAVKTVKELAREIKGGGGGQAFFATAGGKDASGIPSVIESAKSMFLKKTANVK